MASLTQLEAEVRRQPKAAPAWLQLGLAVAETGQADKALECFERAATLDPRFSEAQYNCGLLLFRRGEMKAAETRYRLAIAADPDFMLALSNLGITLECLGDPAGARTFYDEAIARHPNSAEPYWNKALMLLREGEFAEGWRHFEWRWATGSLGQARTIPCKSLWLGGAPLAGKTVLVHEEQGLGDMIQFARFIPDLMQQGARVILQTFAPLVELFRDQLGAEIFGVDETVPDFDLFCPMLSLPLALGLDTPAQFIRPPYLAAPTVRLEAWRRRLPKSDRLRVGVAWKGNPLHQGDSARSLPLSVFAGIFGETAQFVSLQRDATGSELSALATAGVVSPGAELGDFADTAAVIETCDLVISADTSVAHLAGAMGKPLWLLLPARSDWRWGRSGETSAWYPTARLFRGVRQDAWGEVMAEVRTALAAHIAAGSVQRRRRGTPPRDRLRH